MSKKQDIFDELTELRAAKLLRLKQDWNNPFNTPEGYFEKLKTEISLKVESDKKYSLGNKESFAVPENYFNELKQTLKQIPKEGNDGNSISLEKFRKKESFSAWKYIRSFSAVAASLLVIILAWKFMNDSGVEASAEDQLAQAIGSSFTELELQMYIENTFLDTHESELLIETGDDGLDLIEASVFDVSEEYIYNNIDVDDLENYIDII